MNDHQNPEPTVAHGSGNAAVNAAAARAEHTAGRNIPVLEGHDVAPYTANLRLGPSLHDGLLGLLPLVGVWRGYGEAAALDSDAITAETPIYQELTISHDGANHLSHHSRVWKADEEGTPGELLIAETGFWRIGEDDIIELSIVESQGLIQLLYGKPLNERAWRLSSDFVAATATGPQSLGACSRLYGLVENNDLGWVEERIINGESIPRISARLQRYAG